jgi:phosphoribosylglycinamide formyltransferase-1
MNVGVLVSGSGTNLQALIDRGQRGELGPAQLVVVGCNVPDCPALARAKLAAVPTFVLDHRDYAERTSFDRALVAGLRDHQVDLVVLAGFNRVLGQDFLEAFPGRVVNVHPALLPAFPGIRAQRQAFDGGVKIAGCTVHFVDEHLDHGAIILQRSIAVLESDDAHSLSERILAEEHIAYSEAIARVASGDYEIQGRRYVRRARA